MIGPLLDAGADPNLFTDTGIAPLTLAAARGNLESIKLLLTAGAKPNVEDRSFRSPLLQAAKAGRADIAEALLQARADPNRGDHEGITPLMLAAQSQYARKEEPRVDYPATVRLLLKHGARVELKTTAAVPPTTTPGKDPRTGATCKTRKSRAWRS